MKIEIKWPALGVSATEIQSNHKKMRLLKSFFCYNDLEIESVSGRTKSPGFGGGSSAAEHLIYTMIL